MEAYDDGGVWKVTTELGLTTPEEQRAVGQIRANARSVEGHRRVGGGLKEAYSRASAKSSEISGGHGSIRVWSGQ